MSCITTHCVTTVIPNFTHSCAVDEICQSRQQQNVELRRTPVGKVEERLSTIYTQHKICKTSLMCVFLSARYCCVQGWSKCVHLNVADRHPQFQGLLMKLAVSPLAREGTVSISSNPAFYISPIQVKIPPSFSQLESRLKTLNDHIQYLQYLIATASWPLPKTTTRSENPKLVCFKPTSITSEQAFMMKKKHKVCSFISICAVLLILHI